MQLEMLKTLSENTETKKAFVKCVLGTTTIVSTYYLIRRLYNFYKIKKRLLQKRKEVHDRQIGLFQKLDGMVLPLENIKKYCHLTGTELLDKIHSGDATPVDILEAYQANALLKNEELNFIADVIYDADVNALLINRDEKQSLMGFPLSVKDTFLIEKYDCTQGLTTKILQPRVQTSLIIKALKKEGAIPFIITNVCQGLQTMETSNPIFGRTVHPMNHKMTCGGSSGGEGASLGSDSSLIGIGNDAGGSIRIPASYCGIFGLKPTAARVSSRHVDSNFFCNLIIKTSIGPMARYIDDLITTFKVMTSDRVFNEDAYSPPVPFNDNLFLSRDRLKIGFYSHIGGQQVRPVPAVERALSIAKKALEESGHELVQFSLPRIEDIYTVISKVYIADGGERLLTEAIGDGPVDLSLRRSVRIMRIPRFIKYTLSCFCRLFSKRLSDAISLAGGSSVCETWRLQEAVMDYREEVLSEMEVNGIIGIVCPVLPIVAPPHDSWTAVADMDIYCTVYNVLDYPAASVPVTTVTNEDLGQLTKLYSTGSTTDRRIVHLQKDSIGMPVSVQCVARPWRDEICLRIMKDITVHLPK